MSTDPQNQPISFKAETKQLLNILIHSLYTEKEVFLRELISNSSDALTRIQFEMLTNREIVDPDAELAIWVQAKPEENCLLIRDSGVGMNEQEIIENLGTIAHSGAKAFLEAATEASSGTSKDIIGQFGVGFYSAFMVAEWIKVTSRSYRLEDKAITWISTGEDVFRLESADKITRGTEITIKLKADLNEFLQEHRIDAIIKKHSDFIPYPIYWVNGEEQKQLNQQTAIWRETPQKVENQQYEDFYKQFTLDSAAPLHHLHLSIDAPVQLYALLFIPATAEKNIFSLRREDGLKLYARKVLIQDYCKDLLPEFLRFVEGVVDSEDIPLNVSRESIQSNRIMGQLKKIITNKVIDLFKSNAEKSPDEYLSFWGHYKNFLKEGIATQFEYQDAITPLLRFKSLKHCEQFISLDQYLEEMKAGQEKIFYILAESEQTAQNSPHLDVFRKHAYDVLFLTETIDPFMLMRLNEYKEHSLENVANSNISIPEAKNGSENEEKAAENSDSELALISTFKELLNGKVKDVKITRNLVGSPARLVQESDSTPIEMQRVYKYLGKETEELPQILEINPDHPVVIKISKLKPADIRQKLLVEQIYENTLLIEGLHPDPASMVNRIQQIMEAALSEPQSDEAK